MALSPASRARRITAGLLLAAGITTGGIALGVADTPASTTASATTTTTTSSTDSSSSSSSSTDDQGFGSVATVQSSNQPAVTSSRAS